ncbi:acyltransferase [Aporhodopirellula aestuarii]|uniref:acyltransferase n=1 Tax=Aporhodopirellula aestuarii TaxID=2950107 RepID=UPI002AFFA93F|nr:acyltransferase [Aporhodopirellula aestuarii]
MRELPLWLIGLTTNWLPENIWTCRIRGVLARPFFRSCGRGFQYGARVRFIHPELISIGRSVYIAQDGWVNGKGGLTLEDGVIIGPRCSIVTTFHNFHGERVQYGTRSGGSNAIRICEGSWLATGVVVTDGVNIGRGCVIAANAVVTKDTPKNAVMGGVPARVIRSSTQLDQKLDE